MFTARQVWLVVIAGIIVIVKYMYLKATNIGQYKLLHIHVILIAFSIFVENVNVPLCAMNMCDIQMLHSIYSI